MHFKCSAHSILCCIKRAVYFKRKEAVGLDKDEKISWWKQGSSCCCFVKYSNRWWMPWESEVCLTGLPGRVDWRERKFFDSRNWSFWRDLMVSDSFWHERGDSLNEQRQCHWTFLERKLPLYDVLTRHIYTINMCLRHCLWLNSPGCRCAGGRCCGWKLRRKLV